MGSLRFPSPQTRGLAPLSLIPLHMIFNPSTCFILDLVDYILDTDSSFLQQDDVLHDAK